VWAMSLYAVVCLATAALIPSRPATDRLADLNVYLGAIDYAQNGGELYEFHASNGDPFTYPPFAALVLTPLTWLPPTLVEIGWTVATFAAVVALARVLLRVNGRPSGWHDWPIWITSTALLVSAPEQSNVRFGQVSLFLALAVFAGLSSTVIGTSRAGPVAVGLATSFKLTPGMFLLGLLAARRWRHAAYALAALLGSIAVAWLWQPTSSIRFWGHALFQTERIGDLAQPGNQSVYGVLARSALTPDAAKVAWLAIAVVVVVIGLYRAQQLRQAGRHGPALIVVGLVAVAVSPVSWVHHQIWTVLAGVTLMLASRRVCRVAGGLVYLIMVVDTNLAAVAPDLPIALTWPTTNLRALVVVALCIFGLPRSAPDVDRAPGFPMSSHLDRMAPDLGGDASHPSGR
jgi:alpha-1,2-mannosyltransferase